MNTLYSLVLQLVTNHENLVEWNSQWYHRWGRNKVTTTTVSPLWGTGGQRHRQEHWQPPPPSFSKKSIERGTTSVTVIKEMWFMVEGMWYCQCAGIQDTTNLFSDSISSNEIRSNILQCKEITCVPVIKSIVMDINGTWLFGRLSIMFHEMDTKFVFTNRVAYI